MKISNIFNTKHHMLFLHQVLLVLTLFNAICSHSAHAGRVSDKIYSDLQSSHYCSRRLNSTHQMGCSSELGGNLGVVWVVEEQDDLDHILKTGPTPPYIAILRREYYTRKNLIQFKANPDRVTGVIFLDGNHEDSKARLTPFSPDDTCPNRYSGLYANDTQYKDCRQNAWQKESPISGLLYDDIPYPIFLINDKKSIDDIESCFLNHNVAKGSPKSQDTYPLCSMQLDSFMLAASDTRTCLNSRSIVDDLLQSNERRCSTVENENIFAYYKPAIGPLQPIEGSNRMKPEMIGAQSVVMLIAKLSSLSMFTEVSPGADSTITSIVTLLAIAEALGRVRNRTEIELGPNSTRNIAFALLDSEPFDYTGSSRMVYSMEDNSFPNTYFRSSRVPTNITNAVQNINLTSLEYIINLDQLANYPNTTTIYLHSDPGNKADAKLERAFDILDRNAKSEKIDFKVSNSLPLPPTPVHEFIKHSQSLPQENKLLGLVLSNYNDSYNNLFYNSIYDDSHNVFQNSEAKLAEHISQVATLVAKSLYQLAFNIDKSDDIVVDKALVEELLDCYLVSADCNLFTKAWQAGQQLPSGPIQTYKDPTKRSDDMNGAITSHLLAYFLGERKVKFNMTKCYEENERSLEFNYQYVNGKNEPIKDITSGVCIKSQVLLTQASSPAFRISGEEITVNEKYPAWTISFSSIRNPVRLFLKPSPIHQWCIFLLGVVITLISFITVHQIRGSISQLRVDSETQAGTST